MIKLERKVKLFTLDKEWKRENNEWKIYICMYL